MPPPENESDPAAGNGEVNENNTDAAAVWLALAVHSTAARPILIATSRPANGKTRWVDVIDALRWWS